MIIYKYPVPITDEFSLTMPRDAKILTLQLQQGMATMWALVDLSHAPETRRFRIFGTGVPLDCVGLVYIGTFQANAFVWHLFEVVR